MPATPFPRPIGRLALPAAEPGSGFVPYVGRPIEDTLCAQEEDRIRTMAENPAKVPVKTQQRAEPSMTAHPFESLR